MLFYLWHWLKVEIMQKISCYLILTVLLRSNLTRNVFDTRTGGGWCAGGTPATRGPVRSKFRNAFGNKRSMPKLSVLLGFVNKHFWYTLFVDNAKVFNLCKKQNCFIKIFMNFCMRTTVWDIALKFSPCIYAPPSCVMNQNRCPWQPMHYYIEFFQSAFRKIML